MMLRHAAWSSSTRQYSRRSLLLLRSRILPVQLLQQQQPNQVLVVSLFDPSVSSLQGVRWKRRDGNKAFDKALSRPPTKKQRKTHNRKLQKLQQAELKHSAPGSKAGPRREWMQLMKQDLLTKEVDTVDDDSVYEYGEEDALLDDLMGNTSGLTSQPTPQPVYLGHKYDYFHQQILQQMMLAAKAPAPDDNSNKDDKNAEEKPSLVASSSSSSLPSDRLISLALRSYRDKNGTKQKPIGLAMALEYLLKQLQLPLTEALGENSWTTLLTCCRTPAEGRKVFQLQMKQKQQPSISAYSWSILVDLHAKVGDFQGCAAVLRQMEQAGVPPTLPAYTSLIAACAKVCNNGRVAHSVRAQAAKQGWESWMDMRTKGVDPDAMAYGAMLQLTAAVGHAERALNILEEMDQMQVKPTTFCFSCALRAVAKSHATAIRFERGSSKRNKRREFLTKHHGLMAREIVIKAENAEVKQDAGFVSALILCAASAGDVATAKAIYAASQIRNKLDHFRTIGPDSHLARLRGEQHQLENNNKLQISASSDGAALIDTSTGSGAVLSFEEREFGKDSRPLSAILHACAQAVDQNGIGTMWQGRENVGYLCDNSLRLILARRLPRYEDTTIPGQTRTADLTWDGESKDEDYRGNKRRSRKFSGVYGHENGAATIDELDDMFHRIYVDEDGRRKPEFHSTTPDDIWRIKYGSDAEAMELFSNVNGYVAEGTGGETGGTNAAPKNVLLQVPDDDEEMYFDYDIMRWKTRSSLSKVGVAEVIRETSSPEASTEELSFADEEEDEEELFFNSDTMRWETRIADSTSNNEHSASRDIRQEVDGKVDDEDDSELYFDYDTMRWQTRPKENSQASSGNAAEELTAFEARMLDPKAVVKESQNPKTADKKLGVIEDETAFSLFFEELRGELIENGGDMENVSEEEARELFLLMQDEYEEAMNMSPEDLDLAAALGDEENLNAFSTRDLRGSNKNFASMQDIEEKVDSRPQTRVSKPQTFDRFIEGVKDDWRDQGAVLDDDEDLSSRRFDPSFSSKVAASPPAAAPLQSEAPAAGKAPAPRTIDLDDLLEFSSGSRSELSLSSLPNGMDVMANAFSSENITFVENNEERRDSQLEELRQYLPAFSEKRLRKILKVFRQSLGDPSLLTLVPVVRESMPDYITATWLKQMSALTARYVVHKASEEGLVDVHMLNGVLELETLSGSLDRALEFYETEYSRQQIEPNEYSNRLVLQMFVKNGRLSRALAFKDALLEQGRAPDILSYGSLIEYCGRHNQIGSAFLLLKECISVHGAPPGEASLANLRRCCRQKNKEMEVLHADLEALVGPDPVEWLRHGEAHLKREYSKKGRRDVQMARNRLVHL